MAIRSTGNATLDVLVQHGFAFSEKAQLQKRDESGDVKVGKVAVHETLPAIDALDRGSVTRAIAAGSTGSITIGDVSDGGASSLHLALAYNSMSGNECDAGDIVGIASIAAAQQEIRDDATGYRRQQAETVRRLQAQAQTQFAEEFATVESGTVAGETPADAVPDRTTIEA